MSGPPGPRPRRPASGQRPGSSAALPFAALLLFAASCQVAPPPPVARYPLIHPDTGSMPPGTGDGAPVLALGRVHASPHIRGIAIQRRDGPVDTLLYHSWAGPVEDLVAEWVRVDLLKSGRFGQVLRPDDPAPCRHVLGLHLSRFEIEEEDGGGVHAVALIEAALRTPGAVPVWTSAFRARVAAEVPYRAPQLAAALREALARASSDLARAVPRP